MKKKIHPEYQYLNLLKDIMENGSDKPLFGVDKITIRTVFGRVLRFDLSQGFPLLTTKKTFLRGIIHELIWFLSGDSNIKYLLENDVHIWDEWAYKGYKEEMKKGKVPQLTQSEFVAKMKKSPAFLKKWGDLGPTYGVQWRKWPTGDGRRIDQLAWAIKQLKTVPFRKSIMVSAWNPAYVYDMARPGESVALPPCHIMYQLNVNNNKLSLLMFQRSADSFLGVPFNIASYSLLLLMLAQVTGFKPGEFIHAFGDVHIYSNHFKQVKEQIKRKPRSFPKMKLNPKIKNIDDFSYEDFKLEGYNPHPPLKGDVTLVGGF
jgi:thymidylate synthase